MAGSDDLEIKPLSNGVKTLVLVGRTGNGKTSTANSILGFESNSSSAGVTTACDLKMTCLKDGQLLNIIDTPGLFDVPIQPEFIAKEIAKCVQLAKHGIHAVLLVISARIRCSEEEKVTLQSLQSMLGSQMVNYIIVIFTGGDEFDDDNTFEDYLGPECPQPLKDILLLCENRFVLFDNMTKDKSKREKQVEDLLLLVNKVIAQNGGKPYSDELFVELKRGETNSDEEEMSELKVQVERSNQEQLRKVNETMLGKDNDGRKEKLTFVSKVTRKLKRVVQPSLSRSYRQRLLITEDAKVSSEENEANQFVVQPWDTVQKQSVPDNTGAGETQPVIEKSINTEAVGDVPMTSTGPRRRRGHTTVTEPPNIPNLKKLKFQGEACIGENLPGWFRPQMRQRMDACWPRWADVPGEVKLDIYNAVWKEYCLEDDSERPRVYPALMSQFGVIYRKMISEMKRKPMDKLKLENPTELLNVPRPGYLKNDELWHAFVRHWCSVEQMHKSKTNKANRAKLEGSSHGYGRKSTAQRLHEMELQGKIPSLVAVISDTNTKKNSKNQHTGEVYNKTYEKIIAEYKKQFAETHGADKNSAKENFDMDLWMKIPEVSQRTRQGRVLGLGYSTKMSTLRNPEASSSTGLHHSVRSTEEEMMEERERRAQEAYDHKMAEELQEHERRATEQEQCAKEVEERHAREISQQNSTISEMKAQMNLMKVMFDEMRGNYVPSPSSGIVIHDVVRQIQGVPCTQPEPIEEDDDDNDDDDDDDEYNDANDE